MLCECCGRVNKRVRGGSTHVHRVSLASSRRRDGAVMADDGGDVAMRGWLHKEVGSGLKWTRRWFVLSRPTAGAPAVLSYYEDPSDAKPNARAWSLHDCAVTNTRAPRSGHWQFRLNLKAECNTKRVPKWVLSGATREDTLAWVQKLHEEAHVDRSDFQIGVLDIEHASVNGSVDLGRGRVNASTVLQWASRQLGSGLSRRKSQNLATDHASLEASRQRHNLPRAAVRRCRPSGLNARASIPTLRGVTAVRASSAALDCACTHPGERRRARRTGIRSRGPGRGDRSRYSRSSSGSGGGAVPVAASEAKAAPRAARARAVATSARRRPSGRASRLAATMRGRVAVAPSTLTSIRRRSLD